MNLEDALRRALRPESPSAGFADRVAARALAPAPPEAAAAPRRRGRGVRQALAAAAVAVLTVGAVYYQQQSSRAAAERAAHEVTIALQIASDKLALAERRINRVLSEERER